MAMIDRSLPLIDLHRHLEGSIGLGTMLELAQARGLKLPGTTIGELRPHIVIDAALPTLMDFINRLGWAIHVLADAGACRQAAHACVRDAADEGIDYLELRFSPVYMARPHGLQPAAVVEAVVDGVRAGEREFGVMTRLIGIMSRTFGPAACRTELEALLTQRDAIRGLDLAGDEANWPGELFHEHFRRGRMRCAAVTGGRLRGSCNNRGRRDRRRGDRR
jgi:adenosine deaminase